MTMASELEILESYPQITAPTDQTGYTSNLTEEQKQKVIQLRTELVELGYQERLDDANLLRFLRARKFDLTLTKEMFINCEKWRKEFGTNTILKDFHYEEKPIVARMYPTYYHKTDKDGRPVYYEELGKVDLVKITKITTQERMLKNLVWEYEAMCQYRLPACSRQAGHLVETSCTILDLKGISITSAYNVIGYVRDASKIGQDYYPERMGKFYLINAPFGFSTAFKLFKPFLDPVTVSKIHILGYSYKKELMKQIPPQNLPKKYGGMDEVSDDDLLLKDVGPWRDPQFIGPEGEAPRAYDG
ncbi:cytosolic factor, phosphatidylinositol/phosphatidylcholine transfer protein [Lodderomyces elongisporus]|nr:cytosolic factor, phosphatidylinositol/phosphatidylcholine transfer protein [Lodderomyces elongisporus]WLF80751.1 cytosolic factor, phosphatidylinositol/phosphatidylcholine transfer protein [Lodderomyces elongisporus]